MRFTLSSSALNNRLQTLSRVVLPKNTLPILGNFLFEVEPGKMTITASDNENIMKAHLTLADCEDKGAFTIPCKTILDAVKELPDQPLTFDINLTTLEIEATYQNGIYHFTAQSAEGYPRYAGIDGEVTQKSMATKILTENIARTIFATDTNEIRPVMNGICMDFTTEHLAFVASDGHKLVQCINHTIVSDNPSRLILPKKPAALLRSCLEKEAGEVNVIFTDKAAEFHYESGMLACRLIEGVYPNYASAIPTQNPNEMVVDRKALVSALRRVLPFASVSSQLIRFNLTPGNLQLSAEDLDFATSAKEQVVCDYEGQPLQIGFRGDFMAELLSTLETESVRILLSDPSRAGVVKPTEQPENEELLVIVMPLLLND